MTFAQKAKIFYNNLSFSQKLPIGVEVMNPYRDQAVRLYMERFLEKFFSDSSQRILVFGINPGRFGAGLTGIAFTDPVALKEFCGISNSLQQVRERSSEFVYKFIEKWGGANKFFGKFFLTAVSPLGFIRDGKNYNYYDNPDLLRATQPFILETLKAQVDMGVSRKVAILLGAGKNQKFFTKINQDYGFFQKIYVLDHPRFIMQYRRRQLLSYLEKYKKVFSEALL